MAALCASAAGAVLLATSAASRAQEQTAREKKTLEQRVSDLERQVADLRREVAEARAPSGPGPLTFAPDTKSLRLQPRPVFPAPGGRAEVPPGSRSFEFNGGTYYWVPLDADSPRPATAARPSAAP